METYREWKEKDLKTITVTCKDNDDNLENLLKHIKSAGNIGHSFSIVVDPDDRERKTSFSWDGDGSDYIQSVKT